MTFVLPSGIYRRIEKLMAHFLWIGASLDHHKSRVAWSEVTQPRKEGRLDIKKLVNWNKATILKYL